MEATLTKSRVFLAHASEDKPQVGRLYSQLKGRGFDPWLDEIDLIPGQNWRDEIPRAIKTAAVCLACLSKRSVEKRSYVQREFRYALSAYADMPPGTIYLIPVRLDDCEVPDLRIAEIELNLRDLHWVDLFKDEGFEKLVSAIGLNVKSKTSSKAKTAPQPGVDHAPSPRQKIRLEVFKDIDEPFCPEMVLLPTGSFMMGSPEGFFRSEKGRHGDEGPQHEITIDYPFALGCYPVTFAEYDYFCDQTGHRKPDDRGLGRGQFPVIDVSWDDAKSYCSWLSQITNAVYDLPREAEWEYAARAGTTTPFSFGKTITPNQVNYDGNYPFGAGIKGLYRGKMVPAGSLPANAWGLHEMHGNVWEWVEDWYYDSYGAVPGDGDTWCNARRVMRGGCWSSGAQNVRSAARACRRPDCRYDGLGFRCARFEGP